MILTVNGNAGGVWASRVGEELEYAGPGLNAQHVLVRRSGERHTFGFPTRWLDGLRPAEPEEAAESCDQLLLEVTA